MLIKKLALLGALMGVGTIASANQIELLNMSAQHAPLTVDFRIARSNPGEPIYYGDIQHIVLRDSQAVGFDMQGYKLAGLVPLTVNGHDIPEDVRAFPPRMDTCSVATTTLTTSGKLFFTVTQGPDGHGSLTCSKDSGYVQSYKV